MVEAKACRIEDGRNLSNDDSNTVMFDKVTPLAIKPTPESFNPQSPLLMGCVIRSLQIAGAP